MPKKPPPESPKKQPLPQEVPMFIQFPELLEHPPKYGKTNEGTWFLEWRAERRDGNGEITLVMHALMATMVVWSYAIYDQRTNTVRHYKGTHGDMTKDELTTIEEAELAMMEYEFTLARSATLAVQYELIAGGRWQPPALTQIGYAVSEAGWDWVAKKAEEYEARDDYRNVALVLVPFVNATPLPVVSLVEAQEICALTWVPKRFGYGVSLTEMPQYVEVVFDSDGSFLVYEDMSHGDEFRHRVIRRDE